MSQKENVKQEPLFCSTSGGFVQVLKKGSKNDLGDGDYELVPPVLAEFEDRAGVKGSFYTPKSEWETTRLREILAGHKKNKTRAGFDEIK